MGLVFLAVRYGYGMVWYGPVQSLCECHVGPRRGYLGSAHAVGSGDWRPARWCPAYLGPRVALDEVENLFGMLGVLEKIRSLLS